MRAIEWSKGEFWRRLVQLASFATIVALAALGGSCGGGGTKPQPVPVINLVSTTTTDITPGGIVTVVFTTANAESVLFYPGAVNVPLEDTITYPVQLQVPTILKFVAINSVGRDSILINVTMSTATAEITIFAVSQAVIPGGDSTQLSWATTNADSIVVTGGIGKLPTSSGTLWLKPSVTTNYRAIAYNIGRDTAFAPVTVEIYAALENTANLTYYKGVMGSSQMDQTFGFRIRTTDNRTATKLWIHYELVEGDGTLSADSILSGSVQPTYTFSGALGHAILRAKVPGKDSIDVYIRADALIPGPGGQAQYILFSDKYAWVETYNGTPAAMVQDSRPGFEWLIYVDYELALGVVVMGYDCSGNGQMEATEPLYGIIINGKGPGYSQKTVDGLGIGSTYNEVLTAYGQADTSYFDPTDPPADVYFYDSLGITLFANPSDSVVFEMHLIDPVSPIICGGASQLRAPGARESRYLPRRYEGSSR